MTAVPEDLEGFSRAFVNAVRDYSLFVSRGYPTKGVLKLVGDRYRLSGTERNILYRGVVSSSLAAGRRRRLVSLPTGVRAGARVVIDAHNVLFTVVNYLQGRTAFIAVDGYLRDAGNPARRIRAGDEFRRAVEEVARCLRTLRPARVTAYFDEPVTYSKDHIGTARRLWSDVGHEIDLLLVPSADGELKSANPDLLVTSDSTLIDATTAPVGDMARWIIEGTFAGRVPDLSVLVEQTH
jgi:hypothetical protein